MAPHELPVDDYENRFYTPAERTQARRERANQRWWGYGLDTRWHLGGVVRMRRNLFVYEVEITLKRLEVTFVWRRKKPCSPTTRGR